MFLAWRDLRVAKGRFVLVGVVIGLLALMATLLSGLANGLVDDGISGLRRLPLTHLAFQPNAESSFSRSTLNEDNLGPWRSAEGLKASPIGMSFVNAQRQGGKTIDIALFGVEADSFLVPDQRAREALAGPPGVVLGHDFADQGIEVGDVLRVVGADVDLPVLGFTYTGSYGHVSIAFTSLPTWQALLYGDNARGRFSAIAIDAAPGTDLGAIDAAAHTAAETKTAAYKGSPGYSGETETMSLIRTFLVVISALVVGAFFTVWTVQRTRQIGLLKAMGASTGYVVRDALGQIAVVLVLATALGALAGVGLGQFVGDTVPFRLQASSILTSAGLLVLLGLVGCLVAIRRITSVDPAVALGSEH